VEYLEEAAVSPAGAPGVLGQPIWLVPNVAVPNQHHNVIKLKSCSFAGLVHLVGIVRDVEKGHQVIVHIKSAG
jgi:hypothetical protein